MAEAKKSTKTTSTKTKSKTVPAKKPTAKPAGKSVKPKATKTVKTNTAPAKVTAKPAKASAGKVVFSIIIAVLVVAVATMAIACVICKFNDTVMVENGAHKEVATKYVKFNDGAYRMLIPTSLKRVDDEEVKKTYDDDGTLEAVYANDDNTVSIAISKPNAELSNDQISTYLDTMKSIFTVSGKVIDSKLTTTDDHNLGSLKLTLNADGVTTYNQLAFFSYDGKLVVMTFSCHDNLREEWEPVSDKIVESIDFLK